jgi:hypothetical protein
VCVRCVCVCARARVCVCVCACVEGRGTNAVAEGDGFDVGEEGVEPELLARRQGADCLRGAQPRRTHGDERVHCMPDTLVSRRSIAHARPNAHARPHARVPLVEIHLRPLVGSVWHTQLRKYWMTRLPMLWPMSTTGELLRTHMS